MRKTVLSLVLTSSVFLCKIEAQIGIHTSNPQGSFNIDAAKDNPATGSPTAVQQANDVAVTPTGSVGLGTVAPTVKLDIVGTTFGMKNSTASGSWDNIWFNVTPSIPSINASGAEAGLQFNVGSNSTGTYGDGQTLATVATMLSNGNMGIGITTPTNTLDVNGTARVRTINSAPGTTIITPVYTDPTGVLVKTSPASVGAYTSAVSATVASGATGTLITGMTDGAIYKAFVAVYDACVDSAIAEFYVTARAGNSYFAINGLGGNLASGTTAKSPTFNQISRASIATTWTGKPGCQDGGNGASFNYTLTMPSAGTINVTNNGNVSRTYNINLTRVN
jgi:hypothetical protein